jgi:hypothetical protein
LPNVLILVRAVAGVNQMQVTEDGVFAPPHKHAVVPVFVRI